MSKEADRHVCPLCEKRRGDYERGTWIQDGPRMADRRFYHPICLAKLPTRIAFLEKLLVGECPKCEKTGGLDTGLNPGGRYYACRHCDFYKTFSVRLCG